MPQTKIKCPNCGIDVKVDEVFKHQAEEHLKKEYEEKLANQLLELNKQKEEVQGEKLKIKRLKEEQDDIIRRKLFEERSKIKAEAEFKAKKDLEFEILKLKQDYESKSKENFELKKKEVHIMSKERELVDKEIQLKLDMERQMLDKTKEIEDRAVKQEQERNELKKRELEKQIEDHMNMLDTYRKNEIEMRNKEQELREREKKTKRDMENLMQEKVKDVEERSIRREEERSELQKREYEKLLLDQKMIVGELKRKEIEMLNNEQELLAREKQSRLDMEKKFLEKIKDVEEKTIRSEQERSEFQSREYENKLEQQKILIDSLRRKEIEMINNESQMKESEEQLKMDLERQMLEKEKAIQERIVRREQEKNELKNREYEKQLIDQKKLIDELKKKAEQGSQQLQGEVQELALEQFFRINFPLDMIEEVTKGVKGADIIHVVKDNLQQECGKIIYESKRTKSFSEQWISKIKEDQKNETADLAVIVTESMPRDMERFGLIQGVWICNYQEVKSLSIVLREMLLKTHFVKSTQENKGEKMEMLYGYLTSNEFRHQIEAIIDGFTCMKTELDKEKRAMHRIWKEREKQINKVITNTIDMYGSMKGIAGNAIQNIKTLELPSSENKI